MSQNLKARLSRIRNTEGSGTDKTHIAAGSISVRNESCNAVEDKSPWPGWTQSGFKTLKRVVRRNLSLPLPPVFPRALAILVPDLCRMGKIPRTDELLFFDLETTGLSGGAGTLAFIAAFGRFVSPADTGGFKDSGPRAAASAFLEITQYLLLDYPGENDFIECVVNEFIRSSSSVVVSFNGKSFDSQILKTRCLMNGIMVPGYFHADLLHPARRLWKRQLPDCSQATIEVSVLGLDRAGDIPGAFAPEIWFSFLRNGEKRELIAICDHNIRDITGLATLFLGLGEIAAEPLKSRIKFRFDEEALALFWKEALKKSRSFFGGSDNETGELLLKTAAKNGCPRAAFALALDLFKAAPGHSDHNRKARELLVKIADDVSWAEEVSGNLRARAFRSLAIDAEWRLMDFSRALRHTDSALAVPEIRFDMRTELEKRRLRLEEKIKAATPPKAAEPKVPGRRPRGR